MSANAIETLRGCITRVEGGVISVGRTSEKDAEQALAAVEALLEAVDKALGYGADLNPIWQLGAGQDWTEWTEAKDRLRAARRRVETGQ